MRMLLAWALGVASVAVAASAPATEYVPGRYKDGVYIRPHFLDYPGQIVGGPLLLPPEAEADKVKGRVPGPIVLEPATVPQKRPPLPAS